MKLLFFQFFLGLFFGVFFVLATGGRPLVPPSLIASKSFSVYNPAEPIYLNGAIPFLLRRILIATDEVFSRCAMSNTVIPSIPLLSPKHLKDQGVIAKMLQQCNLLLLICIVFLQEIYEFLRNFRPEP